MRILLGVTSVAICLTLAGCQSSSGPRRGLFTRSSSNNTGGGGGGSGNLFLGAPTTASTKGASSATAAGPTAASDSSSLASAGPGRREGVLAGRILDQESKLRPGAIIQVIDLESARDATAPLSVLANPDGYFDISGLEPGRSYRLVARVKDGGKTMSGSARVVPPNVRVAIWLAEQGDAELAPASESKPAGPAATLGTPIKTPSGGVTTPVPDAARSEVPPPVNTSDPTLMADGNGKRGEDGFQRDVPAPRVNIPEPGREHAPEKPESGNIMPPPPPSESPRPAPAAEAPASESVKSDIPESRTNVPMCVRIGHRVENFALYDTSGKVFELAKDRKGKLILLDLWHTGCVPCLRAIPHLNKLQAKYGKHGLEILGITYERGTLAEKQQSLERATRRHHLTFNYRLLFGGGGKGSCPVADQLELASYPTLVLLDENGKILHRCQGVDSQSAYELEMAIYEKLFPRRMAGRR